MSFERLTIETLLKIRPVLEERIPTSAMMLNSINRRLKNPESLEELPCVFYGYNGASDMKNLFIVAMYRPLNDYCFSLTCTPDVVTQEILTAFSKLFDWSKPFQFGAVPDPFSLQLEEMVHQKGGKLTKSPSAEVYLPLAEALKLDNNHLDLQDEFELAKLTEENATKVNSHWKYGSAIANETITKVIKTSVIAGVFKIKTDTATGKRYSSRANEDLVSWIVFFPHGTLNALHVLDDYRRRGIAKWTLQAGARLVAEAGYFPISAIEHYNVESRKLLEKVGFKLIHNMNWMLYEPKIRKSKL